MEKSALSVKQLNFYVKSLIEGDPRLASVLVKGEISNLKSHYSSGHIYFTLKDNEASVSCVMFRSFAARLKFLPENGQQVLVRGRVSVYERDGQYQIYAEEMNDAGLGDIALRFEQTKEKLQKEGLFDIDSKRKLPRFPKKIAVVTSGTGAAIKDILNILSRRWPLAEILVCPVSVQGESAVGEMVKALDEIYSLGDIDLCIIGRGGGSVEDLWAFNEERLAYKIYESPFPVISAVGHETDFTISDLVADLRAPTPSAAAELAVPDINEISSDLNSKKNILLRGMKSKLENSRLLLERFSRSKAFISPVDAIINERNQQIDKLTDRMLAAVKENVNAARLKLGKQAASLDALSPLKTLARGYGSISIEGKAVQSVKNINKDDILTVRLGDGKVRAQVKEIKVNDI